MGRCLSGGRASCTNSQIFSLWGLRSKTLWDRFCEDSYAPFLGSTVPVSWSLMVECIGLPPVEAPVYPYVDDG